MTNDKYKRAKEAWLNRDEKELEERLKDWCPNYSDAKLARSTDDFYEEVRCYEKIEKELVVDDFRFNSGSEYAWFAEIVGQRKHEARKAIALDLQLRNFTSPLQFIQYAAVVVGVDLSKSSNFENSVEMWSSELENKKSRLWVSADRSFPIPKEYRTLLDSSKNLSNTSVEDFGKYSSEINFQVDIRFDRVRNVAAMFDKGYFQLVYYFNGVVAKKKFSEFAGCENEWRSSIHRMLEIFASIPPSKWHDPSIYTRHGDEVYSKNRLNSAVGVKLERVVSVLFTDVEAADINARLRGGSMPSVPRLSIGPTKIPSPGQKNVEDDELVINGAPLLVERLSSLGVMKPNEAEALVARKLENYFVHNSGFQLSREKALEILEKLRGKKAVVMCAT